MMQQLGYSADSLLVAALQKQVEYESDIPLPTTNKSPLLKMQRVQNQVCYDPAVVDPDTSKTSAAATPLDEYTLTPKLDPPADAFARVQKLLVEGLRDAVAKGLSGRGLRRLKASLKKYQDNYRVQFGLDPPVKVTPLKVKMKVGVLPVKCKARCYPLLHRIFLEQHVKELFDVMLIRENNRNRWASAPCIVPKKEINDLRMTVDSRDVKSRTKPIPFPMPQIEVAITHGVGATVFFSCVWFKV
ncbi:unnamed protein product [Phytophthora fragariaefolia]|uniref:Unnamed protein product n=1 Tax=Phytophthora fragariaefolia TaxID=1490495 RepID=A0A9W7CUZ0_9STRA|nr:unnamed protein product [Phytophthora fragariaefolia]